jgi:hypothetical protein
LEAATIQRGLSWVHEAHAKRERGIQRQQHNPLHYGWEQPPLKIVRALLKGEYQPGMMGTARVANWKQSRSANDLVMLGGNGSGKTELQAKLVMEVLDGQSNREARCFSQNEATSVRYIQRAMFRYLRPELRQVKSQGQVTKISYKESTGFSEGIFILPWHSAALFPTYKSWEQDPKSVEGGECHVLSWDEEAPSDLIVTLRFRVHKVGGFLVGGFTPVHGYTDTVAQYTHGGRILETIPARDVVWDWVRQTWSWGRWLLPEDKVLVEGCPPGHVPLVIESAGGAGRRFAVVLPTMFNPYTDVAAIIESVSGKPTDHVLERLWGWTSRKIRPALQFADHHIVPAENVPPLTELTIYQLVDPCPPPRNWFMLWVGVDREGRVWVLAEWPDIDVGEWAVPGTEPDGKPGEGAFACGPGGFGGYKLLILAREGWAPDKDGVWHPGPQAVNTMRRLFDPRAASWRVPSAEEGDALTYIDHMLQPVTRDKREIAPGLVFEGASAAGIDVGNEFINGWLTDGWNPQEPLSPLNCPRFYINGGVRDEAKREQVHPLLRVGCQNTIWCMRTFTGRKRSGAMDEKSASKDPIDCLKAGAKTGLHYLATDGGVGRWVGGGGSH